MSWVQLRATVSPAPIDWSPFVEAFLRHGVENTLLEADALVGCVVDVPGASEVVKELAADLEALGAEISQSKLPESNWEDAWKQFFKPRRIGSKFVIRPTWEPFDSEPDDCVIVLDPGQAFGTGDHPTTRLCLELMETVDLRNKSVADVGCGSGVLSIAAKLLGAAQVDAVDIDPIAAQVARQNAALNGVEIEAIAGEGFAALLSTRTYDLILSNIISATLIRVAPEAFARIKPGGQWIVSGIMESNWPDVRSAAEGLGFQVAEARSEDDWVAARFERPGGVER